MLQRRLDTAVRSIFTSRTQAAAWTGAVEQRPRRNRLASAARQRPSDNIGRAAGGLLA